MRVFFFFLFFLIHDVVFWGLGQDEGSQESEVAAREFMETLESPLYDLELRKSSPPNWLAQCEQVLQQAVELLDPSTSSGLVIAYTLLCF